MSFFKNLISSALGTFIALGLLFVFMLVFFAGSVALMDEEGDAVELEENTVLVLDMGLPIQDREPQTFSFASALEIIPRTLAENAGLDPVNTIIELRKSHADGNVFSGINVEEGGVMDMRAANVLEPQRVVEQAIQSATETAIMILRIDDVISSKGVSGDDMMGGMGGMGM